MYSELYGNILKYRINIYTITNYWSRKVGDVRFTAPVTMRNEWTTIRKQYKCPGSTMLNKKLACGVPLIDKNGNKKVQTMWMPWVEWQFEQEWSDEKNSVLMFGKSNRNSNGEYLNHGKSGEVIDITCHYAMKVA